jgi:SAM-dependent methyltransferase
MNCRSCGAPLDHEFIDLINAPPSNSFLTGGELNEPEIFYPLKLFVCSSCFLVQIDEYKKSGEIFNSEYVYFSSYSSTWLEHAHRYADMMTAQYGFDASSLIMEIASNDGYLLSYFIQRGIPVLGIEPAEATAIEARKKGIETIVDFFGERLARNLADHGRKADLLIGNNVLAHVPDLNDFVTGLKTVLKPAGIITMEFPHLVQLVDNCQFDTIYHEHFSYLSFTTVRTIFNRHGLELFDVEEIPTHGGSLRIFAKHAERLSLKIAANVNALLEKELSRGITTTAYYGDFQKKADTVKYGLLDFLLEQKRNRRKVVAYGAAAKGNTLLNYCGVKKDLIDFVADASPHKQGKFLPGSHIPVVNEQEIRKNKPDFVLILPWNIKEEIMAQLQYVRSWGGRFAVAIPSIKVI